MESLGIEFPFKESSAGGVFKCTTTDINSIKSNLTAFLTLRRKQRPMHNSLYSPLYDYLMETWDEISEASLSKDLSEKIAEFFPEISIQNFKFDFEEESSLLNITLFYFINDLKISDKVSISITVQN